MVDGYRVLKNRLIHDDVICPQDADAAHLAFWERIQQLETLIECGITALEHSTPNHPQIEIDAVLDAFREALSLTARGDV